MSTVDLIMPKLGESITEATILKWYKNPGDKVKMDETVLDIATDKVDSEVPSTAEGIIESILFKVNDVVPVGSVIARIKTEVEESISATPIITKPVQEQASSLRTQQAVVVETTLPGTAKSQATNGSSNRFYSPLVLNIAANEGISMTELENIPGTGQEGRVSKKDILAYVANKAVSHKPSAFSQVRETEAPIEFTQPYDHGISAVKALHKTPSLLPIPVMLRS